MSTGSIIRSRLKALNKSYASLAEEIEISTRTVQRYVQNQTEPTLYEKTKLSLALNVDIDCFVDEANLRSIECKLEIECDDPLKLKQFLSYLCAIHPSTVIW